MEKFIYQVKIEKFLKKSRNNERLLCQGTGNEEILRIQDHLYQFYFIRSDEYDDIYHYIYQNDKDNVLASKKYVKIELKRKIIDISKIKEDEILEITRKHFYQYDHNLWNDVNDWLNGCMFTNYKEYQLLFIPQSYSLALVSVEQKVPFNKEN